MVQPAMVTVQVLERTDAYSIATWRRLMLLIWRAEASAAGVERSRRFFQPWAESLPGGAAFLVVVPGQRVRPPDDETRAAMERTSSAPTGPFKGMATLIEAEGFIAASVRSLMTRLLTARMRGATPCFFRTVADTAAWASKLLEDPEITAAGLEQAIRQARQL